MAVTVPMQFTSAVTELYQDAFVGAAMENGTTILPFDACQPIAPDSGKKKAHTEKHLLLVHAHTSQVVSRGPTAAGKMHHKQAADEAHIASPVNATLDKETGCQGYEPSGVLTQQPNRP